MAQRMAGDEYIRKIDFVLHNEGRIRKAVRDARADSGAHGGKGSGPGDPTAAMAIRKAAPLRSVLVDGIPLERPEEWLRVVDAVYAWCAGERLIVARDRYGGTDYRRTCAKLNISQTTYSAHLRDIRHYAALCAAQLGLVKVF